MSQEVTEKTVIGICLVREQIVSLQQQLTDILGGKERTETVMVIFDPEVEDTIPENVSVPDLLIYGPYLVASMGVTIDKILSEFHAEKVREASAVRTVSDVVN